jgi:hypothetical protein
MEVKLGDATAPSLEEQGSLRRAFDALDTTSSGNLTLSELTDGLSLLGLDTEFDATTLLRQADTAGDGVVSWEEFLAIVESQDWKVLLARVEMTERKQQELDGQMRQESRSRSSDAAAAAAVAATAAATGDTGSAADAAKLNVGAEASGTGAAGANVLLTGGASLGGGLDFDASAGLGGDWGGGGAGIRLGAAAGQGPGQGQNMGLGLGLGLHRWHSGDMILPDDKLFFQDASNAVEILRAMENIWESVRRMEGESRRHVKQEILALGSEKQKQCPEIWVHSVGAAFGAILRDLDREGGKGGEGAGLAGLAEGDGDGEEDAQKD